VGYASSSHGSVGGSYVGTANQASYGTWTVAAPVVSNYRGGCPDCLGGVITSGAVYPSTGIIIEGSVVDPRVVPSGEYYGPTSPENAVEPVTPPSNSGPAPSPSPDDNDGNTGIQQLPGEAILNVQLPEDAKIYVNDRLTSSTGDARRYVSRRLKPGKSYSYNITAAIERDGKQISVSKKLVMKAGEIKSLEFDFEKPILTQVTVRVPEDAKITLSGNQTSASGKVRRFKTMLKPGQQWNDYTVEVSLERDGRTIREKRTLDISAGQQYVVDFEFDAARGLFVLK
jgi:uncharacterized protein (TIGR03000 family)